MASFQFRLNHQNVSVEVAADTPLLYVLRNDLGINGSRYGCGLGQCGACSVLLDGTSVRACVIPVSQAQGKNITTLEGLGSREAPHPLQQAFIDEQAMQCGYCTGGIIMTAAALLAVNPDPSEREIRSALDGHICRCGSHSRIIRAVHRAARINKDRIR